MTSCDGMQRRSRRVAGHREGGPALALALVGTLWGGAAQAIAAQEADGPDAPVEAVATLDGVSWLAGQWRGEGPGGSLNETWIMEPRAGVMTGAMRLTIGEDVGVQEMITISETDGGVVMLLRHFDGHLLTQEEEPIALHLVEWGPRRAVFEGAYGESALRTTAEARPSGGWTGRSVITRPDGTTQVIESVFEPAASGRVLDTSYRTGDGMRVLRQEIVLSADPEALWPLFSTAEGFSSWAVPHAWMDFRVGGTIETSYRDEAVEGHPHNIRNRILAYVPGRMLSIQAVQAPPGFPAPEILGELFTVIELEPVAGGGTRVVVNGLGYRDGEPFRTLEEFFRRGNEWTLEQLRRRVEEGLDPTAPPLGP